MCETKQQKQSDVISLISSDEEKQEDSVMLTPKPPSPLTQTTQPVQTIKKKREKGFYFAVSSTTGRIFVYDNNKCFLGVNVSREEISDAKDLRQPLSDSQCLKEVREFLEAWDNLKAFERKRICGVVSRPPFSIPTQTMFRNQKKISYQRYDRNRKDSVKTCQYCQKALKESSEMKRVATWESFFCSYDCYKSRRIRAGHDIRETLFELERGVCQICHVDAHDMFRRVHVLTSTSERRRFLSTHWPAFQTQTKAKIFNDPKEGDFWQADHIIPVVEGGGTCDISNLRTLCTPCHEKETSKLMFRKKFSRAAKGCGDIRTCLLQSSQQNLKKRKKISSDDEVLICFDDDDDDDDLVPIPKPTKRKRMTMARKDVVICFSSSDDSDDEDDEEDGVGEEETISFLGGVFARK